MSEMIEKVARAMLRAIDEDEVYLGDSPEDADPRSVMIDGYVNVAALARAAIEAMRDVDNDMLEAMHNAMFVDPFDATNLPMLGAGFEAAIDAALKDKP